MKEPCDFCEISNGDPVDFIGLVSDEETKAVERFRVRIFICYICRVVWRRIADFSKEAE
jgi:hypothetical protein